MQTDTSPVSGLHVFAAVTCVGVLVLVALAAYLVVDYNTYTGDDPLIGLDIVLAIILAAPAVLGGSLTAVGWLLRRTRPSLAQGLAIAGTVVVALPLLAMSPMLLRAF